MSLKLIQNSIEEITAAAGKSSPSIGGSTAAAISALIAIAVAKMALLISAEKARSPGLEVAATRFDSISMRLQEAAETDKEALQSYLDATRTGQDIRPAWNDATTAPLALAHIVLEALELLESHSPDMCQLVTSDYFGAWAMLDGSFSAIMMAIEANLRSREMFDLDARTSGDRACLRQRRREVRQHIKGAAAKAGFDV